MFAEDDTTLSENCSNFVILQEYREIKRLSLKEIWQMHYPLSYRVPVRERGRIRVMGQLVQ